MTIVSGQKKKLKRTEKIDNVHASSCCCKSLAVPSKSNGCCLSLASSSKVAPQEIPRKSPHELNDSDDSPCTLLPASPTLRPTSPNHLSVLSCRSSSSSVGGSSTTTAGGTHKSRIFPSMRFLTAILLCLCYMSLAISTTNISVGMVCMVRKNAPNLTNGVPECESARIKKHTLEQHIIQLKNYTLDDTIRLKKQKLSVIIESCQEAKKFQWSSLEQAFIFSAQNAGSLLMLFTGNKADRFNSKWAIVVALSLLVLSNVLVPMLAHVSFMMVVMIRVLTGFSDALLQPSTSSLITRWFPPKERPFAIGLITGGRQIGSIFILPMAGFLCDRKVDNGWPAIFHLSAVIGALILIIWLLMSADKPSKHFCTSITERFFVEEKIAEEKIGKRTEKRKVPWRKLATCRPLYIGVAALICHEYPLVIMLQLLPSYISDVLKLEAVDNGLVSALPIAVMFISKTLSSSLASFLQTRKKGRFLIARTPLVKLFNGIASLGLGVCIGIVTLVPGQVYPTIVLLCLANAFAGLHTPGVQTALLQLAPAYTGTITGIAFGIVAITSIINKLISGLILKNPDGKSSTPDQWATVLCISAVIALLPVVFFTLWGSADRQPWATTRASKKSQIRIARRLSCNTTEVNSPANGNSPNPPPRIFVTQNSMVIGQVKAGSEENVETGADEDCDDDCGSVFEQEADDAIASALRLHMFLKDPSQEPDEYNDEESSHCTLSDALVMAFPTFSTIPDISMNKEESKPSTEQHISKSNDIV